MKKKELNELYNCNKRPFLKVVSEIIISYQLQTKFLIILFINYLIINNLYSKFSELVTNKLGFFISLLISILSLGITAYFTYSFDKNEVKVLSLERLNRAFYTLKSQIKTVIFEVLFLIPYVFLLSIVGGLLIVATMLIFKLEPTTESTYPFIMVLLFMTLIIAARFLYSTYITILFDIDGSDAVRLSKLVYKTNKVTTMILFTLKMGIPVLSYIIYDQLKLSFNYMLLIGTLNTILSFLVIQYIAAMLPQVLVQKDKSPSESL